MDQDRPEVHVSIGLWLAFCVGCGLLSLLVGNAIHDDRLVLAGLSLNPLLYFFLAVSLGVVGVDRQNLAVLTLLLFPSVAMLLSVFWSYSIEYGLFKYVNLVVSTSISFLFFAGVVRAVGATTFLKVICLLLIVLLGAAFVYKLRNGFFVRDVAFFLNGPIVFARLMSLGAIAALVSMRGIVRAVFFTLFLLATLWTESKGPVAGLLGVFLIYLWIHTPRRWRPIFILFVASALFALIFLLNEFRAVLGDGRLLAAVDVLAGSAFVDSGSGSFGSRFIVFRDTLVLIARFPLGVGLGGWESAVTTSMGFAYPHNIFLEVFSEAGLLLGVIGLVPFLVFLVARGSSFFPIALYFLVVQQVSGDLQDARFLLLFSILSYWQTRRLHAESPTMRVDS